MNKLNLPNKITICRIILSFIILIILMLPWGELNLEWPLYSWGGVLVNLKYIVVGILFLIASLTDAIDGYLARSQNIVTDFGKLADAIADKILINGLLIILAYERSIPLIIPVVIITRDIITDSCKMFMKGKGTIVAASLMGKIKTICMMSGVTLTLFYNLPFEFLGFDLAGLLLITATILSVISGVQYYINSRKFLFNDA